MAMSFALAGNPNSGKTTLFNILTGSRAHVGNWPGVTVERREGHYKKNNTDINIVDLPGIYSLSPYSEDEIISRNFLLKDKPELVINIVDATNLERNLYLTTQLMELGIPVVVALNMMDEVKAKGDSIDYKEIEKKLGIPVVPISASKGEGIDQLMESAVKLVNNKTYKEKTILSSTIANQYIEQIKALLNEDTNPSPLFNIVKLLEGDEGVFSEYRKQNEPLTFKIHRLVTDSESTNGKWDVFVADARYKFITDITSKYVKKTGTPGKLTISDKIDSVVTHKILAIPIFLIAMFIVFQITFGSFGSFFADSMDVFVNETLSQAVENLLIVAGASDWAISLVVGGIIPGVGMVMVFLPQILILFFFLTLLEDSGYMSRAAFIMDRILRKFGLSGKAFVPMLMGFGCSVPAIMATRTLEQQRDRRLAIILTPFMSCGARMPVYAVFAGALFASNQGIIIFSIYVLGILAAIISGIILKNTVLRGEASTFIMELPPYRVPAARNVILHLWEKAKGFIVRAGTILLAASIVIWILQTFNFSFQMVDEPSESIFGVIGAFIAPIFSPLGFGDWRASMALLTGFIAKEIVVSTLGILYGAGEVTELTSGLATALQTAFTPASAYAYMTFVLMYMPCVVAFAAIKREMNSWKWTAFTVLFQTSVAWIAAFLVYQIGSLFIGV